MSVGDKCDRFDLEEQISKIDGISDDLEILAEAILDGEIKTPDDIANILVGTAAMMRLRANKLFHTFEEAFDLIR